MHLRLGSACLVMGCNAWLLGPQSVKYDSMCGKVKWKLLELPTPKLAKPMLSQGGEMVGISATFKGLKDAGAVVPEEISLILFQLDPWGKNRWF